MPALIPSWRFFQTVAASPRVEYRVINGSGEGVWRESHPLPDRVGLGRMLRRMLWNPHRNAQLYMVSLSERLAEDGRQHAQHELNRMIAEAIPENDGDLQFRLVFLQPHEGQIVSFVEYESDPVSLAELRR
ncbi:MAG: hypothetical protein N4A61_15850 [Pelagimonas sp.]|nr:hypothetical protein [Pelagimonas sp.]